MRSGMGKRVGMVSPSWLATENPKRYGGRFQVIAGHRRLAAFRRLLELVGGDPEAAQRFKTIPAHEKFDVTDEEMALFALIELCGAPHNSTHVARSVMWRSTRGPSAVELGAPHK